MRKKEKGMALLTTLIFGVLAIAIVAAFLYVLTRSTTISKQERLYTSALEAAKGVSFVILEYLRDKGLQCKKGGTLLSCEDPTMTYPAEINLVLDGKDFSNIDNYNLTASMLSFRKTAVSKIYTIKVIAKQTSYKTKAEITFVVEVD